MRTTGWESHEWKNIDKKEEGKKDKKGVDYDNRGGGGEEKRIGLEDQDDYGNVYESKIKPNAK